MIIELLEPGVFWSDILLGLVVFICAGLIYKKSTLFFGFFFWLGIATLVGAIYHGFINTPEIFWGEILWSVTMISFGLSSLFLLRFYFKKLSLNLFVFLLAAYSAFIIFIDASFKWGLLLQAISVVTYFVFILKNTKKIAFNKSLLCGLLFLGAISTAVYIQQFKLALGTTLSHNTIFHLISIPAFVFLYLSFRYITKSP